MKLLHRFKYSLKAQCPIFLLKSRVKPEKTYN